MEDFFKMCITKVEEHNKQVEALSQVVHIEMCISELNSLINMIEGLDNIVGISDWEQQILKKLKEFQRK